MLKIALKVRLPKQLHMELVKSAKANGRSLNSEINIRLRHHFPDTISDDLMQHLLDIEARTLIKKKPTK